MSRRWRGVLLSFVAVALAYLAWWTFAVPPHWCLDRCGTVRAEARRELRSIYLLQEEYFARNGRYGSAAEVGFLPPGDSGALRYDAIPLVIEGGRHRFRATATGAHRINRTAMDYANAALGLRCLPPSLESYQGLEWSIGESGELEGPRNCVSDERTSKEATP